MKLLSPIPAIVLALFSLAVTGCMKEDDEGCEYEGSFVFRFAYDAGDGTNRFSDNIESVGIYVFDENFYYVTAVYADRSRLQDFQGVALDLIPGDYYVVGWGNHIDVYDYPTLEGGTALGNSAFEVGHFSQPFYYAPVVEFDNVVEEEDFFKITVPTEGSGEATLKFIDASRPVKVTVIGLREFLESSEPGTDVEITSVPAGYDFKLSHLPTLSDYRSTAPFNGNTEDICEVTFHTPFFDVRPDIDLNLYRLTNDEYIHGLNLREALDKIGYVPEPTEPLDIQIEFGWGGITIKVNGWEEGTLTPEL